MIRWRIVAVAALLVGILAAGWALRIDQAGEQRAALSADERSYVRIAEGLQRDGTYGDGSMRDPFHWAPGAATLFALAASSTLRASATRRPAPGRCEPLRRSSRPRPCSPSSASRRSWPGRGRGLRLRR